MKHEWRKSEKELYMPKAKPQVIEVPKLKYFTIEGEGNPNNPDFSERIGALYALSYAIRMMPKKGITPEGYFEYTVYPLEGVWDLISYDIVDEVIEKDNLKYKIMIRQPEFVTDEVVEKALEIARKKQIKYLDKVVFEEISDGLCVQMLHIGPYENENITFNIMEKFMEDNNYKRTTKMHREIYLSDFRRVDKDKLKTVLRCFVEKL